MRLLLSAVLLGMLGISLPGCNVLSGIAYAVTPPELVEARHDLANKRTLIVIDDRQRLVNNQTLLNQLAMSAQSALESEGVVTKGFVGQDELLALREELGPAYASTSLAALAIRLGAGQVIHAEVADYRIAMAGNVVRPSIQLQVKVFDLDARARVFPKADPKTGVDSGEAYYPVLSRMEAQDLTGQSGAQNIAARKLAQQAGRDLGRLFFDWRRPEVGADLGKR